MTLRAYQQIDPGPIILGQAVVNERLRGLVNVRILDVAHDANHGGLTIAIFNVDGLADRILIRPVFYRHRLADDDDFRRLRRVRSGERSSRENWDSQRGKIDAVDDTDVNGDAMFVLIAGTCDVHLIRAGPAGKRHGVRKANGLYTGHLTYTLANPPEQRTALLF